MPSQKRSYECTIDEALNDFWYDDSTPGRKRKHKADYQPVPLDPPSPSSTHLPFNAVGNLDTYNQGMFNQGAMFNVSGPQQVDHDLVTEPLPVKGKVGRTLFIQCETKFL